MRVDWSFLDDSTTLTGCHTIKEHFCSSIEGERIINVVGLYDVEYLGEELNIIEYLPEELVYVEYVNEVIDVEYLGEELNIIEYLPPELIEIEFKC